LVAWTTSDEFGAYELLLPEGEYRLKAYLDDYSTNYVAVGETKVEVTNGEVVRYDLSFCDLVQHEETTTVSGILYEYITKDELPYAMVEARRGWGINIEEGTEADPAAELEIVDVVTTDAEGRYSFELENGYYTFVYKRNGYVTGYKYVAVTPETDNQQTVWIVKKVLDGEKEYRVEITLDDETASVDVCLVVEYADGTRGYIREETPEYYKDGRLIGTFDKQTIDGKPAQVITVLVNPEAEYRLYTFPGEEPVELEGDIDIYQEGYWFRVIGSTLVWDMYGRCYSEIFDVNSRVVYKAIRKVSTNEDDNGWMDAHKEMIPCEDFEGYYIGNLQ